MGFVQIIDIRTSRFDELKALGDEWEARAGSESRARRRVLCQDRNDPSRYLNIVYFDSYDDAMENSKHPTTQEFSAKMAELTDGPPSFIDLDVVEDVSG